MLYSSRIDRSVLRSETGAILPLATLALVAALFVVGLIVDAGNLYRTRAVLQNAADSAAMAAVLYSNSVPIDELRAEAGGGTDQALEILLAGKARAVMRSYVRQANVSETELPDSGFALTYTSVDAGPALFNVRVTIDADIDSPLLGHLPFELIGADGGSPGTTRISVAATSRRKVANVAILFDASRSMACPAEETGQDCTCLKRDRDPAVAGCAEPSRMDKVITGLKSVSKSFNSARDNLVFVPFNTISFPVDVEMMRTELGVADPDPVQIEMILDWVKEEFEPQGSTNICDALIRAHQTMELLAPQQEAGYVLVSDGAATATRFLFSDAKGALPPWPKLPGATHDYTHYSLNWSTSIGDFPGPSLLVQTDLVGMGHRWVEPPRLPRGPNSPEIARCGPTTTPAVDSHYGFKTAVDQVFSNCVNSLAFQIPGEGKVYGADYRPGQRGFERFQEQYYNCPLAYADFLRRNQATVHVLGYGQAAPQSANRSTDDPYQNARESSSRKDYFLARLSNSYVRGVDLPRQAGQQPFPDFRGLPTYDDWQQGADGLEQAGRREGEYFATPDLSQIDELFSQIVQQITISLIE